MRVVIIDDGYEPGWASFGYDDVFTRIDKCRAHYARGELGASYIDQFIR